MKFLITLVVLCTALLFTLDAAPVIPSGYETFEIQQPDEMMKISPHWTGRDGSIQADNKPERVLLNVASSILSAASKEADPNDELLQTVLNEFNSTLSLLGNKLNGEGGEIQSGNEMMQTVMNLFGTLLSGITKKIDSSEVHVQSGSEKDAERRALNAARNFFSVVSKKADPSSEVVQTFLNGANTLLSLGEKQLDNGGEIQSSDNEVKQALMNLVISFLPLVRKAINNSFGEAQFAIGDEFHRTFFNIAKVLSSAMRRNADPNDDVLQKHYGFVDAALPILADVGELNSEKVQTLWNQFGSLLSAATKKIENSNLKIRSRSSKLFKVAVPALLNYFSNFLTDARKNIEPDDNVERSVINHLSTLLSNIGRKIYSGTHGASQIQSDINSELLTTVLNFLGTVGSEAQKKAKPNDEFAQPFFTLFNTMVSASRDEIRGAQEVHADTLPTYTAKHFDQSMTTESVDENAVIEEADVDLSEEATIQLWGAILSGLTSGVLNKI